MFLIVCKSGNTRYPFQFTTANDVKEFISGPVYEVPMYDPFNNAPNFNIYQKGDNEWVDVTTHPVWGLNK